MFLGDVMDQLAPAQFAPGPASRMLRRVVVRGLTPDASRVLPGSVFVALPEGQRANPLAPFAAAERGAAAVICEPDVILPDRITRIEVPDTRRAFAAAAAAFFGHPDRQLDVLVLEDPRGECGTGTRRAATNRACLLASMLAAAGEPAALLGELGGELRGRHLPRPLSELDAFQVFELLSQFASSGGRRCILDATPSSDALVAALTAPRRGLPDEPATGPGVHHWRGSRVELAGRTVCTRLVGSGNLTALRGAFREAQACGFAAARLAGRVPTLPSTPGFLEPVNAGQPFGVFLDGARTPAGLTAAIEEVRSFLDGRLLLVTGGPASLSAAERERLGEAAAAADRVFVTADDPGFESVEVLSADLLVRRVPGQFVVEPARGRAIQRAVTAARPGDVVLVAGKGHRRVQAAGGSVMPVDDRRIILEALAVRGFGGTEL